MQNIEKDVCDIGLYSPAFFTSITMIASFIARKAVKDRFLDRAPKDEIAVEDDVKGHCHRQRPATHSAMFDVPSETSSNGRLN